MSAVKDNRGRWNAVKHLMTKAETQKYRQTKAAIINFNQAPSLAELIISVCPFDLRRWYNISLRKLLINLPH